MILLIVFRTFNASFFVWCQPAPTNGNIFVSLAFFWSNFHRLLSIYTNFILCNDQQLRSSYTNSNNHTWIITSNHFISHFWCSISTWNYCIFYFVKEPMESRIPITIIHTSFTVPLRIFLWIHFKCTVHISYGLFIHAAPWFCWIANSLIETELKQKSWELSINSLEYLQWSALLW